MTLFLKNSLYAQSYSAIAHSFVENISAYQKLQQRYESLLEDHYVVPQFFSDSSVEQEEQNVVLILPTTLPKEGNRICPTPIDGGLHGEPDAVSSDCMHAWSHLGDYHDSEEYEGDSADVFRLGSTCWWTRRYARYSTGECCHQNHLMLRLTQQQRGRRKQNTNWKRLLLKGSRFENWSVALWSRSLFCSSLLGFVHVSLSNLPSNQFTSLLFYNTRYLPISESNQLLKPMHR